MDRDIVFITGANKGLGYETVKALFQSSKPYHVFLGSRCVANGEAAVARLVSELPLTSSTVEVVQIDIEEDESIVRAADLVERRTGRVDVLINNAGIACDGLFNEDIPNVRSIFTKTVNVNVTGTQVVTAAFVPLLLRSAAPRLIFISSGQSSLAGASRSLVPRWTDGPSPGWPKGDILLFSAYKASKAALNMLMVQWHGLLKGDGVRTWGVSPGFLVTDLAGGRERWEKAGAGDPATGGGLVREVVEGEKDGHVGTIVAQNGIVQEW